jgi:GntP family gluconate:H+ symporter
MDWTGHDTSLVIWAIVGIAIVVVLITQFKVHPFIALILGSGATGLGAGLAAADVIKNFTTGFGTTLGGVGILVALGTMLGKLLADSGGADRIVETIVNRTGDRKLPWAMALIAMIIGIPLFFEIGVVLLIPVIFLVAQRARTSVVRVGIPALAGLSVMHGLVPPHPGPLIAINALNANLGQTLGYGLLVAIPTVIIAGPLYGGWIGRRVQPTPPAHLVEQFSHELVGTGASAHAEATAGTATAVRMETRPATDTGGRRETVGTGPDRDTTSTGPDRDTTGAGPGRDITGTGPGRDTVAPGDRPSFAATLATVLLPVALMLARALTDILLPAKNPVRVVFDFVGDPLVALLLAVLVAMFTFGYLRGFSRQKVSDLMANSLAPIAGIVMIIGAGGGFKQILVAMGIGASLGKAAAASHLSALILGWLIAVGIRLATGSATVATVTAAGLMAPLLTQLPDVNAPLLALAIGSGSLFLSHVNDAGFWLVKEYFGMSVGQTFKTWSAMETIISVVSIVFILLLGLVV